MKYLVQNAPGWLVSLFFVAATLLAPQTTLAHCDTLAGPVVETARVALEKGDVTPLFKWVRPAKEDDIQKAFAKTLAMRSKGADAKAFADRYFFETLVRIHRAGEGAPYSGLKPGAAIDPAVSLADQALDGGSVDKLVKVLTNAMAHGIRERFTHAYENRKHADDSVAMGREFVESYVDFTHYVEGLHGLIKGHSAHHGGETASVGHADSH